MLYLVVPDFQYRSIQLIFLNVPVSCFIHGNACMTDAETSGYLTSPHAATHDRIPTTVAIDLSWGAIITIGAKIVVSINE